MAYLQVEYNLYILLNLIFEPIRSTCSHYLPLLIKMLIGYCHFFYQLGYGLVFYIYIYRRSKAKRSKNWSTFYGNSILNWFFLIISIFNKVIVGKNFLIHLKTKIYSTKKILQFVIISKFYKNITIKKTIFFLKNLNTVFLFKIWTPLFKRSSYIAFLVFLKRFTKRK